MLNRFTIDMCDIKKTSDDNETQENYGDIKGGFAVLQKGSLYFLSLLCNFENDLDYYSKINIIYD